MIWGFYRERTQAWDSWRGGSPQKPWKAQMGLQVILTGAQM